MQSTQRNRTADTVSISASLAQLASVASTAIVLQSPHVPPTTVFKGRFTNLQMIESLID